VQVGGHRKPLPVPSNIRGIKARLVDAACASQCGRIATGEQRAVIEELALSLEVAAPPPPFHEVCALLLSPPTYARFVLWSRQAQLR
jgi:hypothetical protein